MLSQSCQLTLPTSSLLITVCIEQCPVSNNKDLCLKNPICSYGLWSERSAETVGHVLLLRQFSSCVTLPLD